MTERERAALIEEIGELELADYIPARCGKCMYWEFVSSSSWFIGHCSRITQEVKELSISRETLSIYTDADSSCELFAPSDDAIDDAVSDWQDEQAIRETEAAIRVEKQPI